MSQSNIVLNMLGGILGGGMAMTVITPKTRVEGAGRLFCSIAFAVLATPIACHFLRLRYTSLPSDYMLDLAVSGVIGLTGWFALHPPLRYLASLRTKKPKEFIGDIWSLVWSLLMRVFTRQKD